MVTWLLKLCLTLVNPWTGECQASLFMEFSFFRGPSWPRDWTLVSCTAGRFFTNWATRKAQILALHTTTILNQILYGYTVEVRNRFKGLDLIDRVPDELWTEVCDIVQETGIKTIPMEKKWKKAKWLSEEALQIAVKRREVKRKWDKERYKHLNAEFQRIARRDKKAFLSDQCKEIEENNRMGKTRDLFNKIRDTKGTLNAKMGSIKDRNGIDLTEAEEIKKR